MTNNPSKARLRFRLAVKIWVVLFVLTICSIRLGVHFPPQGQKLMEGIFVSLLLALVVFGWALLFWKGMIERNEATQKRLLLAHEAEDEQKNPYTMGGPVLRGSVENGYW